jgi:Holliday junction resolvasome RuvABC endonuclease subunit
MKIKVAGLDPSTSNFGVCKALVDVSTLEVTVDDLILFQTENESKKGVIKTSDDLRRAREVTTFAREAIKDCALVVSEIPLGSAAMYNNAILNAGVMIGVLAGLDVPLIEVSPQDVKIAAVGHRGACKEEMIEWAVKTYPNAPWLMRKLKGKLYPVAKNEHLADAVATVLAGVKTAQFRQALAMYRSMAATA